MQIDDIKNPALEELFEQIRHASGTIENDARDALEASSTEEELIAEWQSYLESLKNECHHFWGELEAIKNRVSGNTATLPETAKVPMGMICVRNPAEACHNKVITPGPETMELPACTQGSKCDREVV